MDEDAYYDEIGKQMLALGGKHHLAHRCGMAPALADFGCDVGNGCHVKTMLIINKSLVRGKILHSNRKIIIELKLTHHVAQLPIFAQFSLTLRKSWAYSRCKNSSEDDTRNGKICDTDSARG